ALRLGKAGARVRELELAGEFAELTPARALLNDYERARAMAHEWRTRRDALSERLRRSIERGLAVDPSDRLRALELAERCRVRLAGAFQDLDLLVVPCVPGEAPEGLESTGEPQFQELWTLMHVPSMSLPTHRGPNGLPVGIQLVAPMHAEAWLFQAGRWIWQTLGEEG